MYHFFVSPEQIEGDTAYITGPDVNHITNVLRMRQGEKLLLSKGEDWDYLCEIRDFEKDRVMLSVISENKDVSELPAEITLYQGLPKSDKLELIIQKAVELGVYKVVPVVTERTVVKLDEKKTDSRVKRWQAISESAAKQSGRCIIPAVGRPVKFTEALKASANSQVKLIPYELSDGMERTREIIASVKPGDSIAVFIGPEGGFSENEINEAVSFGFTPVTLGKRILRTETAGLVMLSLLMAKLERD